ncbi:MAG: magnesium chelatase subunit H [Candidatus Jordarchaeaceae archaeon]
MPTKITVLATIAVSSSFAEAVKEIREEYGEIIELKLYYVHEIIEELVDERTLKEDIRTSDIVLLDIRSRGRPLDLAREALADQEKTVITLVGGTAEVMSLTRMGSFSPAKMFEKQKPSAKGYVDWVKIRRIQSMIEKMGTALPFGSLKHARNWIRAMNYWKHSGKRNIKNLLLFVASEYGGQNVKFEPPVELPPEGIYHPKLDRYYSSLDDYLKENCDPQRPSVGILFYGGMHFESSIVGVRALIEKLENRANVIPVYSDGVDNLKAIRKFFFKNGKPIVDAAVSFVWFRINGGPLGGEPQETLNLLKDLNIPFFDAAPMYMREIEKWKKSTQGFSPVELIAAVTLPELDGLIEPVPSLGLRNLDYSDVLGADVKLTAAIEDRIERIAGRILNWLNLRKKKNSEKRIAIVIYNYPPGESNVGNAAYLDVFASLDKILERLRKENYNVGDGKVNFSEFFTSQGLVNSGKWSPKSLTSQKAIIVPVEKYREWFGELSEELRKEVVEEWGEPPGSIMSYNNSFLIPGLELGNVFVGLQPTRGVHENPAKAYHDKNMPPHHQYIAFYKWLEKEWSADAVIHLGTHGTIEFMKGKEAGMSNECYPDFLMGNMPHLYVYHITNPSEAMIAKRRSYATLINHMSPPYTQSGLYEEFTELEELINEYYEAKLQDPVRAKRIQPKIVEKARQLNIDSISVEEIYDELFALKRSIIPSGLHIFGEKYKGDALIDFISFVLRYDRGEIKSLNRIISESMGIDYEYALSHPNENHNGKSLGQILTEIEDRAKEIIRLSLDSVEMGLKASGVKKSLAADLGKTLSYGLEIVSHLEESREMDSLIQALNGNYVFPNLGGDPIRTPEVLPTGSNTYQFDPRLIPSDVAYERGVEIAEKTLKQYHDKNGRYPESVAVVLWGFETVKTRGETVGQILGYLGVRIVREKSIWFPKLKLIPLEELGRPRIDVVVNMCGFFRDMFPDTMKLLDEAFNMVASLDEEENKNYVKKHSEALYRELVREFSDEKMVKRLSNARIFGPRSGEYGTRLTRLIETSNWESESQVAEAYIASMNNVYAENIHGEQADKIYRKILSNVELVSQVRDTHEYEVTDLDHYYEFFGGLSKAVEDIRGKKPEMLISDTTREQIKTETVDRAIQRGVRTRLLNPKWINGMLKHQYHGGQKIADRVEYLLGFAATTNKVENWIWSKVAEDYVFNEEMRKRLQENNKWALHEMMGRLLEANQRGYWQATQEELDKLRQLYLELEGELEE